MLRRILSFVALFVLCYSLVYLVQYKLTGWSSDFELYQLKTTIAACLAAILFAVDLLLDSGRRRKKF